MFERLAARGAKAVERRRQAAVRRLAERLENELPAEIDVEAIDEGVVLSGRGLGRRAALDPEMRAIGGRLR